MTDLLDHSNFTIRRKVFKLFGAAFHVFDGEGNMIGYSAQKAFKLREDIRIYRDESRSAELLTIAARHVIDFSAAYDVVDARDGTRVGTARRRGFSSMVRDSWELLDADERPVATVREDSVAMAMLRRLLSNLVPQKFHVKTADDREQATFRVHFNPFVYRMTVDIGADPALDRRLILAAAILIAAIEQRQS